MGFCCFCYNGQAQENLRTPAGNLLAIRERAETDYRNAFKYAEARGRSEGEARGRGEGRAEGGLEMLFSLVRDGLLSIKKAFARAGTTESDFAARMERPSIDGAERSGPERAVDTSKSFSQKGTFWGEKCA